MDTEIQIMIELVRSSLNGGTPALVPGDEEGWKRLFHLSRKHGVVTIVNDAIERLPEEQKPKGDIALSWALSADRTREIYSRQETVLKHIQAKSAAAGLRVIVLKGLSLSRLYPTPSSRACGDIDLYFPGAYEEGNRLFAGGEKQLVGKHSEFEVEGVTVENHLHFLDLHYRSQRRAEEYIRTAAESSGCGSELPPYAGMMFLLMHTISHITATDKLALRNVIDWGLYLEKHEDELSPAECRRLMEHIGMTASFDLLTQLAGDITGADLSRYIVRKVRQRDYERMRRLILTKSYSEHVPKNLPIAETLKIKVGRYRQRRWLYRYLPATTSERRVATFKQVLRIALQKR